MALALILAERLGRRRGLELLVFYLHMVLDRLTSFRIERNGKIVVFDRILGHVQTDKVGRRIFVFLRKSKLGIYKANTEFSRPAERLHEVGTLQNKVHTGAVLEIGEEDEQLYHSLLSNNLDSSQWCFPLLVDWNDHPPAGNSERCGHTSQVSKYQASESGKHTRRKAPGSR